MEDKPTAKPPEGVDLEKALAEFSDNMRKLNDKVIEGGSDMFASGVPNSGTDTEREETDDD